MESALYPIHALMRSFTTWEDLSLPEHQHWQQQFFSATENFRYTGSMIRVKKRPTRNIHIATQSSDCSWENQEFNHLATSFYQYPISICLKIDETHIRPAVLFREKRSSQVSLAAFSMSLVVFTYLLWLPVVEEAIYEGHEAFNEHLGAPQCAFRSISSSLFSRLYSVQTNTTNIDDILREIARIYKF